MSDPVLAFVLLAAFLPVAAAARFFRTLDANLWRAAQTPLVAGLLSGAIVALLPDRFEAIAIGVVLTASALYVRLTGDESDTIDGMLLGACSGVAAAAPLAIMRGSLLALAGCILAGTVAGFGITFAAWHVADRLRQTLFDVVTAAAAIGVAWLPRVVAEQGVNERRIALASAALAPLIVIVTVFAQWPAVRRELADESALGFVAPDDVRTTAHPFLRFGRGGWTDPRAHREFVRLANRVSLRKRQQRRRREEIARLYQLEIIKLRMQIQEMSRIDHATRARAEQEHEDELPLAPRSS